ncbi:MAG: hypothetical protein J0H63_14815, partial [Rhizobiales bacterium]|nr:hypothetical protein [Hyphomicrobiales bacterium]
MSTSEPSRIVLVVRLVLGKNPPAAVGDERERIGEDARRAHRILPGDEVGIGVALEIGLVVRRIGERARAVPALGKRGLEFGRVVEIGHHVGEPRIGDHPPGADGRDREDDEAEDQPAKRRARALPAVVPDAGEGRNGGDHGERSDREADRDHAVGRGRVHHPDTVA